MRTLAIWLLLLSTVWAGEFQVDGESYRVLKSPFRLIAGEHDIYDWESTSGVTLRTEDNVATVNAKPGKHTVSVRTYTINWEERRVDRDRYELTFVVTEGTPDPGNPSPDPVDPEPDPEPDPDEPEFSELADISRIAAGKLDDDPVAKSLIEALRKAQKAPVDDLDEYKDIARDLINGAFRGHRLMKDWYTEWRKPCNEWLGDNVTTAEHYRKALGALADGLESAIAGSVKRKRTERKVTPTRGPPDRARVITPLRTSKVIKYYYRPNCFWCDEWERLVMPRIRGWTIEKIPEPDPSLRPPRFHFYVDGQLVRRVNGYMSYLVFQSVSKGIES